MHIQRTQADSIERRRWGILGVLMVCLVVVILR